MVLMSTVSIIAASVAAWIWGFVWYSIIGKRWMEASGLTEESVNRRNPAPYIVSLVCAFLVAAMMNHILYRINATVEDGVMIGLTTGLLIVLPWMATNIFFGQRPKSLIWMDGLYPVVGMTIMGLVLTLISAETYATVR